MSGSIVEAYDRAATRGELQADPAQRQLAERLDRLAAELAQYEPSGNLLGILRPKSRPPRGLYIQGDVGCGKTMLLDMFFERAPVRKKRRVHFHEFMQEVHAAIFAIRKAGHDRNGDAVVTAARDIAAATRLLCFDEFQVNDIADAMMLGRLFEALFAAGTVIVLTSNVRPADLYRHGLNRQVFLPFIRLIEERLELVALSGSTDYRLQRVGGEQVYFCPLGAGADARMQWLWKRLTDTDRGDPLILAVKSRVFRVPQAAKRIARFDFADLCQAAVGAADYLAVAAVFDTVFVEKIPELQPAQLNEARRFTTLVDTLYDRQIRLVASAETPPEGIYAAGLGTFEFARTVSRLREMISASYWAAGPDRARAAILT
jgi:cell division protein ZapE